MREVIVSAFKRKGNDWEKFEKCHGIFHQFIPGGENGESSAMAIVEFEDGTVEEISVSCVRFVKPSKL